MATMGGIVRFRVTDEQKVVLERYVAGLGRDFSEWARETLLTAASTPTATPPAASATAVQKVDSIRAINRLEVARSLTGQRETTRVARVEEVEETEPRRLPGKVLQELRATWQANREDANLLARFIARYPEYAGAIRAAVEGWEAGAA